MIKAVIITENESDCNIAKEYGFNSIFMNDFFVSDGSTEILKEEADIFYLLFGSNENQSTSEEMLKLAESMFKDGIEAEIIILQNSLKDYISQNGQEALIPMCHSFIALLL